MHAVSFVRTSPHALGEEVASEGDVCVSCGHTPVDGSESYQNPLSLDQLLLRHPSSTFFVEVSGVRQSGGRVRVRDSSCVQVPKNDFLGVCAGDILTIDRSMTPLVGHLVLAVREGVFVLGRFTEHEGTQFLVAENGTRESHKISEAGEVYLWGVVTAIIKRL